MSTKIKLKKDVKEKVEWNIYKQGYNVRMFAEEELDSSPYHIRNILSGRTNPSPELAKMLCKKLGFKFNEIFKSDTTINRQIKKVHLKGNNKKVYCGSRFSKYDLNVTDNIEEVTCKRCLKIFKKQGVS